MIQLSYTKIEAIPGIRDKLISSFKTKATRSLDWRRRQLWALARLVQENHEALAAAVHRDLGRPIQETYVAEIGPVVERACISAEKLEEWTRPDTSTEVADWQKGWQPTVYSNPRGVGLVIAPWNYPVILSLQPLMGAIAAGCCAVLKPSEVASHYAALITELIPKYLDPSFYQVVNGGIEETTELLKLKWDHIVFTGNGKIGRVVATAAAKHLTPVTLELGGKSPVIIDGDSDLKMAAKRTLYGKINNSGQICVCPDYALVSGDKRDEFVAALKEAYDEFFPEGALASNGYGRIINPIHHARIKGLLERTAGKVAFGGKLEGDRGIEPTVIVDVKEDDALLEEEIFGPLLPIISVENLQEAVDFINSRPHPLVLYAFTQNPEHKKFILEETTSGNICFNDTFQQLSVSLPFGGVGESGYGKQVLKNGFDGFTYTRSCVDIPKDSEAALSIRYPPYNEEKMKGLSAATFTKIPEPLANGRSS